MSETLTLDQAYAEVQKTSADPDREVRYIEDFPVGKFYRQGDMYVKRIESLPENLKITKREKGGQLVRGASLGSNHTVGEDVEIIWHDQVGKIQNVNVNGKRCGKALGPYLVIAEERGFVENKHPHHADFSFPAGTYEVSYQTNMIHRRQVAD